MCKTINPESGATIIDYDAAGNVAWSVDGSNLTAVVCDRNLVPLGARTSRSSDAMNRLTAVSTPGGSADLITTYYADGAIKTVTAANPGGNNVTTSYTYNKRRLLTAEVSTNGGASFPLGYDYDANGHPSALTYPDGQTISTAPDALGRATQVASTAVGGPVYASNIAYYPSGAISGFKYGNGIVHTMIEVFNPMTQKGRPLPERSRDVIQDGNGVVTATILDDSYAFDANGNFTDITDRAQAGKSTRGMSYDGLDRLSAAVSPGQWGDATYLYDVFDNLTVANQGTRKYRYRYTNQRLTQVNDDAGVEQFVFGHDAQGNVASKNSQAYVFDSANRLNQVTGQQTYRYDGQGRRVQTTDADGKTTFWIYSQSGQLLYTVEARRNQNLSYIYLGNTQVATRTVTWGSGTETIRFQHTDALGSIVAETSVPNPMTSTVTVLKRNSYAPYGEPYAPTAIDGTGYTGHVMDQATGLTYMQQRYYDPQIGRFLSVDPATTNANTGDNFNRFWYARNSPLLLTDPDGRWSPKAHDKLLLDALIVKGLPTSEIRIAQQASRDLDDRTQGPEFSNQHSMAKDGQSSKEAIAGRDKFIGETMVAARDANRSGDQKEALRLFGEAMHPVMDSSSPEHSDSQGQPEVWTGLSDGIGHSPNEAIGNETVSDLTPEISKSQSRQIGAAYDWVFETK